MGDRSSSSGVSEIEDWCSEDEDELFEIKRLDSIEEETADASNNIVDVDADDIIYVVVTAIEDSSMGALVWSLNHVVNTLPSTVIYLVYVFPEVHSIPTPLGKLPINQVNPEQKENYLVQERGKRRQFLQKFLNICSTSKVKVETILIESDTEAKSILDLIPILNMKKLVLGISKSSLRKLKSRKGNETADQILQNVPGFCEFHIICEGKEVVLDQNHLTNIDQSPSPSPSPRGHGITIINNGENNNNKEDDSNNNKNDNGNVSKFRMQDQTDQVNASFACCFKPKALV